VRLPRIPDWCAEGLDVLKFEQTSLSYSASYFSLGGGLELFSEGLSPPKAPRGDWTVWQDFSLLFNPIDSEKYSGYAIYKLERRYVKLSVTNMTGTKVIQRIQVSTLLRGKICAGTIFPSLNTIWLK